MLPREKFINNGIDTLTDTDLICILVGSGIKGMSYKKISSKILRKLNSDLKEGKDSDIKSMSDISGVGKVTAMRILAGIELGRRIYGLYQDRVCIRNSKEAYEYLKDISYLKQEHIVALYLNSRFELLERKTIRIGGVDSSGLLPRDVITYALELNSSYVVLAHNHPSGDSTPSNEDITLTKRIQEAMDIVGIKLLEHIVIAKDGWKSVDIGV